MSTKARIEAFVLHVGGKMRGINTAIGGDPHGPDLTALVTTNQSSLVAAINEVASEAGGSVPPASETVAGTVELATVTEAVAGVDTVRVVTPAGVKAALEDLRVAILGAGVPSALDTLDELASALGDDSNFAATVTTSLSNKQPIDADLTAIAALASAANKMPYATGAQTWSLADLTAFARSLLDDADAAAARTTLDVYSKAEMGDPEFDYVAAYEAVLNA